MQTPVDVEQLLIDWNNYSKPEPEVTHRADISGLVYIGDYINTNSQDLLLQWVDQQAWLGDLKRRVQHYGYKYDYKARRIDDNMYLGALPRQLERLALKLHDDGWMPYLADQVIVNEYEPGQGISSHIDCEPCFDDTIISLTLGSGCIMNYTNKAERSQVIPIWLEPRSLIVMQGEARYQWLHSIPARQKDEYNGQAIMRERRVSLTFRKIKI
jgi:alkylated DNA repair dioxygenase AlkB